jgi:hypothetical protein
MALVNCKQIKTAETKVIHIEEYIQDQKWKLIS